MPGAEMVAAGVMKRSSGKAWRVIAGDFERGCAGGLRSFWRKSAS